MLIPIFLRAFKGEHPLKNLRQFWIHEFVVVLNEENGDFLPLEERAEPLLKPSPVDSLRHNLQVGPLDQVG